MSGILIYSPKCSHSNDLLAYIKKHPEFTNLVKYHNVNTHGLPPQLKDKVRSVPTLITKSGKILVGKEIKNWFESLLPNKEITNISFGGFGNSFTSLDGEDSCEIGFDINNYGQSLQPALTPELQSKIERSVSEAFSKSNNNNN